MPLPAFPRLIQHDLTDEEIFSRSLARLEARRNPRCKGGTTLLTRTVVQVNRSRRRAKLSDGEIITLNGVEHENLATAQTATGRCSRGVWFEVDLTTFNDFTAGAR